MTWLKHTYASKLPKNLFSSQAAIPVNDPKMVLFNDALAIELGIDKHLNNKEERVAFLSGNDVIPESLPIAQAYAGHQFGHFTQLGDGRAVLLGEMETKTSLFDLQLKGSGQTPYSRRGDGRATLYSMLREYLMSEAIHALGIPTTRSLAVVTTGEKVLREDVNAGAVLSRVASSHIRVGTFEYARYFGKPGDLEKLLHYTLDRHYPQQLDHPNHALAMLEKVMQQQIELVTHWMRVGFIHGVMNTDNMAISGETIDYGPCAFMNAYHPGTVFSSIDTQGRYAYGNQPNIAYWNLRVFANALLPAIDSDEAAAKEKAQKILNRFPGEFSSAYLQMMSEKLGITRSDDGTEELLKECLELLAKHKVDYTNFFTALRGNNALLGQLREEEAFEAWRQKWEKARSKNSSIAESEALMIRTNPVIIPRNHLVEDALNAAVYGDMSPLDRLLQELATPYDQEQKPQEVPAGFDGGYQTFCGT